jgi:hypothetical protein
LPDRLPRIIAAYLAVLAQLGVTSIRETSRRFGVSFHKPMSLLAAQPWIARSADTVQSAFPRAMARCSCLRSRHCSSTERIRRDLISQRSLLLAGCRLINHSQRFR